MSRRARERVPRARDAGSAAVDFVLVGGLVTVLFLGVLQLGLALHVRTLLIDSAAEGARLGARLESGPGDAESRTKELISSALSDRYARDVTTSVVEVGGAEMIEVRVRAPMPVIALLGPSGTLEVRAHALAETPW